MVHQKYLTSKLFRAIRTSIRVVSVHVHVMFKPSFMYFFVTIFTNEILAIITFQIRTYVLFTLCSVVKILVTVSAILFDNVDFVVVGYFAFLFRISYTDVSGMLREYYIS